MPNFLQKEIKMPSIIVVFKSKTEVFLFMEYLKNYGISSTTVGTPREAKVGCGLSVKISKSHLNVALSILRRYHFDGFHGIYQTIKKDSRLITSRLI